MSVQAITCALAIRGITASEKLVLLALSNYADEHMRCWASQERLAGDACLTTRTMQTALAALEARRMISREKRRRPDGTRGTDIVTLHFAGEVTAQAEIISPSLPSEVLAEHQPENDCKTTGNLLRDHRKMTASLPERISPLTTFEPSIEERSIEEPLERARARRTGRRCPNDWMPSVEDRGVGTTLGMTPGEIDRELAKIRDHEFRNPRSDWSAVFRNWLRTAAERNPRESDGRHPQPSNRLDAKQANLARSWSGADGASTIRAQR